MTLSPIPTWRAPSGEHESPVQALNRLEQTIEALALAVRKLHTGEKLLFGDGDTFLQEEVDDDVVWNFPAGGKHTVRHGTNDTVVADDNSTAGETRFMLWDVDNATLERVSVGIADSGGSGFKVLRIPN